MRKTEEKKCEGPEGVKLETVICLTSQTGNMGFPDLVTGTGNELNDRHKNGKTRIT